MPIETTKSAAGTPYAFLESPVMASREPLVPIEKDGRVGSSQEGNWAPSRSHQSALYQHCAFWDPDGDGIIWPSDTFHGFHALGFNFVFSFFAALFIHGGFSWPSTRSWIPDPMGRIFLDGIHRCKHGSDTGAYDTEGRFVTQKLNDFFVKYGDGESVNKWQIWEGVRAQRCVLDLFGWVAEMLEWIATYLFLWPEDGLLRKEDVKGVYDGSIFPEMAQKRAAAKERKKD